MSGNKRMASFGSPGTASATAAASPAAAAAAAPVMDVPVLTPEQTRQLLSELKKRKEIGSKYKELSVVHKECNTRIGALQKDVEAAALDKNALVRQHVEQIENLRFNYESATARIKQLQDQMAKQKDEFEKKAKSGTTTMIGIFGGTAKVPASELKKKSDELEVVRQELSAKIDENGSIQNELIRLKDEQQKTLQLLQNKLEVMKVQLLSKDNEVSATTSRHAAFGSELQRLTASHQSALNALNEQLQSEHSRYADREREIEVLHRQLCTDLRIAVQRFQSRVTFDEHANPAFNEFNLHAFDRAIVTAKLKVGTDIAAVITVDVKERLLRVVNALIAKLSIAVSANNRSFNSSSGNPHALATSSAGLLSAASVHSGSHAMQNPFAHQIQALVALTSELESRFDTFDAVLRRVLHHLTTVANYQPPNAHTSAERDQKTEADGDVDGSGDGSDNGHSAGTGRHASGTSPALEPIIGALTAIDPSLPASSCALLTSLAFLMDSIAKWPAIELEILEDLHRQSHDVSATSYPARDQKEQRVHLLSTIEAFRAVQQQIVAGMHVVEELTRRHVSQPNAHAHANNGTARRQSGSAASDADEPGHSLHCHWGLDLLIDPIVYDGGVGVAHQSGGDDVHIGGGGGEDEKYSPSKGPAPRASAAPVPVHLLVCRYLLELRRTLSIASIKLGAKTLFEEKTRVPSQSARTSNETMIRLVGEMGEFIGNLSDSIRRAHAAANESAHRRVQARALARAHPSMTAPSLGTTAAANSKAAPPQVGSGEDVAVPHVRANARYAMPASAKSRPDEKSRAGVNPKTSAAAAVAVATSATSASHDRAEAAVNDMIRSAHRDFDHELEQQIAGTRSLSAVFQPKRTATAIEWMTAKSKRYLSQLVVSASPESHPVAVPYAEAIANRQRLAEIDRLVTSLQDQLSRHRTARAQSELESKNLSVALDTARAYAKTQKENAATQKENGKKLFVQLQTAASIIKESKREIIELREQLSKERTRADQATAAAASASAAAAAAAVTAANASPADAKPAASTDVDQPSTTGPGPAPAPAATTAKPATGKAASSFFANLLSKKSAAAAAAASSAAAAPPASTDSATNDSAAASAPTPAAAPATAEGGDWDPFAAKSNSEPASAASAAASASADSLLDSLSAFDPDQLDAPSAAADGGDVDVFVAPPLAAPAAAAASTPASTESAAGTTTAASSSSAAVPVPNAAAIVPFMLPAHTPGGRPPAIASSDSSVAAAAGAGIQPFYSIRIIPRATAKAAPVATPSSAALESEIATLRSALDKLRAERQFQSHLETLRRADDKASIDALRASVSALDRRASASTLDVQRLTHKLRVVYGRYSEMFGKLEEQRRIVAHQNESNEAIQAHYKSNQDELTVRILELTQQLAKKDEQLSAPHPHPHMPGSGGATVQERRAAFPAAKAKLKPKPVQPASNGTHE